MERLAALSGSQGTIGLYRLNRIQQLPTSLGTAWQFFSDPHRLAEITPPWLGFRLISEVHGKAYQGMILHYRITPVGCIPVSWISEITHLDEPHFFVDEQRFGPYRFWHHQHLFEACEYGIRMQDIVHYILPYGRVGRLALRKYVQGKLDSIFDYRAKALRRIFEG